MIIKVKDADGNIYSIPSKKNENSIVTIHYCTSYIQFEVQGVEFDKDRGVNTFPKKDVIVLNKGANFIDLIAVDESEIGEIVECRMTDK